MAATIQCLECQEPVPAGSPVALCARCLVRLAKEGREEDQLARTNLAHGSLPRQFGDYQLLEQIGIGGMGIVYRALHLPLHRLVAVKMIHSNGAVAPSNLTRFRIEAEAAAMLEHPHIVSTYDAGEVDGQPYLTMRLIEGSSLARRLADFSLAGVTPAARRAGQEKIVRLLTPVARAVQYAHEHGVIHRDLKPNNILLDRADSPHLGDFGIAKLIDRPEGVTRTADILGTPHYMSPEQAVGKGVGPASDIYSLGIILYELLTGKQPFRASSHFETLQQVLHDTPTNPTTLNPGIERDLATICLKCLEKDPLRRYRSAGELADDLERWQRREPIHAHRVSAPARLAQWCRRKPALAAVAVLLIVVSILSTIAAVLFAQLSAHREREVLIAQADSRRAELERQKTEHLLRVVKDGILIKLNALWDSPDGPGYVDVSSETRATLDGRVIEPATSTNRLTFAVYSYYHPTNTLGKFSPILSYLETNVTAQLRTRELRVDFRIFRSYSNGITALRTGEVDFMRIGPSSYLVLKEQMPDLDLLGAQAEPVTGAIFTRRDSDIRSLADLRRKAFAFGDRESTTGNYLAKLALVDAGLHAQDLSPDSRHFRGHEEVMAEVRGGRYAAGAANTNVLNNPEFRVLKIIEPGVRMPWVTTGRMDPQTRAAITAGLLELHDRPILKALESNLTGFRGARHEDYDRLRADMDKAAQFGGHP